MVIRLPLLPTICMFQVDLYTADMPAVFARFREVVGERHWTKRVAAINSEARGQSYLREYLVEANTIAFALDRCSTLASRHGAIPPQSTNDRSLYPVFRLAAQTLSLMDKSSAEQGKRLVRRIHGALKNPDDMRAIQLEFGIATHFVRRGCSISWPEMEGTGDFDLMVHGMGPDGLEVECKSASTNKGRKIHTRDALVFNHLVRLKLEAATRRLNSGLTVVLTVPERLPAAFQDRQKLADRVGRAVLGGKSVRLDDGSDLRLSEFDIAQYPDLGPPLSPRIREDIDHITGTHNREAMILGRKGEGALVFVVQSHNEDTVLRYVFDSVRDAARKQLSGNRAGIVLVGLEGISADGLVGTAQQDKNRGERPTALRIAVSDFLSGSTTDHVVGVGFLSRDEFTPEGEGQVSSGGSVYHFPKTESRFWHDDFRGMFREME
jgi:hypothetical protein